MIYTIKNTNKSATYIGYRKIMANKIIFAYPMKTTEQLLDRYIFKKYKTTLKLACLKIIGNCKWNYQGDTITITLMNPELDKLAKLITYGTGKLLGSNILRAALA